MDGQIKFMILLHKVLEIKRNPFDPCNRFVNGGNEGLGRSQLSNCKSSTNGSKKQRRLILLSLAHQS